MDRRRAGARAGTSRRPTPASPTAWWPRRPPRGPARSTTRSPPRGRWNAPAEERAATLVRAAQWIRERRLEIAALAVRECAKPWPEADADVCEAIDFLEYYARGALDLAQGAPLLQPPGERNELRWDARGIVAVISPWNFPVAIALGMTAAGLATGNAVILKPAEQSPGCALVLTQALRESGVPPSALALLPGEGDVGAALVRDPRVHTIAFTGSNKVGLDIVRAAAETPPGQKHLKRVIAEMGGKNCVIVDSDADLDEVVPALVKSAFLYAGQKCSAAARVLVPRGDPRRAGRAPGGRDRGARGRPGRRPGDRRPARDRAGGAGARGPLHRRGRERRPDRRARPRGARRRLVRAARAGHRPAERLPRAHRRDLRPAAGRRARARTSTRRATASTPPPSPSPAACSRATRTPSTT